MPLASPWSREHLFLGLQRLSTEMKALWFLFGLSSTGRIVPDSPKYRLLVGLTCLREMSLEPRALRPVAKVSAQTWSLGDGSLDFSPPTPSATGAGEADAMRGDRCRSSSGHCQPDRDEEDLRHQSRPDGVGAALLLFMTSC